MSPTPIFVATRRRTARRLGGLVTVALLSVAPGLPAAAQDTPPPAPEAPAAPPAPQASPAVDLKAAFFDSWDDAAGKLESLAEAIPAEKYTWRPSDGVRSVSELYMHVAGANYFIATALGKQLPEGLSPDLETVSDKQVVLDTLRDSIAHLRSAVAEVPAATLGERVNLFGREMPRVSAALLVLGHIHEHLGQAIAYARMNGVVPPWSRPAADEGGEESAPAPAAQETSVGSPADGESAESGWHGQPIDMSVRDADLVEVVRSLAQLGGVNVVLQPGIEGRVTVELHDVPWDQALDAILRTQGLAAEIDGRDWRIAHR